MNPVVSIVIPCYRQAHFLAAAIDSAIAQSYGDGVEIVVVNDGSDDDTEAVARRYGDRIVYHGQRNGGLASARNAGIAVASGTYLHFLDSDDRLHPDAIRWLVEAAAHREDVLCVMRGRTFEDDDDFEGGEELGPPAGTRSLGAQLLMRSFGPPLMYLASRSMVNGLGGFDGGPAVRACEDWDLWTRLVYAGADVVAVDGIGAFYRRHESSMSRNLLRMARSNGEVLRRTLRRVTANPARVVQLGADPREVAEVIRGRIAKEWFDAGFLSREEGQYASAFRHYWGSLASGRPNLPALSGMLKLLPHQLLRSARRASGAAVPANGPASAVVENPQARAR